MGQTGAKICDQCLNCMAFLRTSTKKNLEYLELEDFGATSKGECKENSEIVIVKEIVTAKEVVTVKEEPKTFLVDPTEFLSYYLEPIEFNCEKIIDKEGFQIYGRTLEEGFLVKAIWNSRFQPETLYAYFRNLDQRKLWDKNIEKIEEASIPDSEEYYTYMRFKKVIAISQRDSVIVSQKISKNDGILIVSKSVTHDLYPETENITRMKIFVGGFYFKSLENSEYKTRIFSCTKASFGGNMSNKFIMKATASAMPGMYKGMEKSMEAFYK